MKLKHIKHFVFVSCLSASFSAAAFCEFHGSGNGFGRFGSFSPFAHKQSHIKPDASDEPRITHKTNVSAKTNEVANVKVSYDIGRKYRNVEFKFVGSPGVTIENQDVVSISTTQGHYMLAYRVEKPGAHSIEIETRANLSGGMKYKSKQKIQIMGF